MSLLATLVVTGFLSAPGFASDETETVIVTLPLPPRSTAERDTRGTEPAVEAHDTQPPVPADLAAATNTTPPAPQRSTIAQDATQHQTFTLDRGESLYSLFAKHGYSRGDLMDIIAADAELKRRLSRLRPGQHITIHSDGQRRIHALVLDAQSPDAIGTVREQGGFVRLVPLAEPPKPAVSLAATVLDATIALPSPATSEEHAATRPQEHREPSPADRSSSSALTLAKGQSLYELFQEKNLSRVDLLAMIASGAQAKKRLSRLRPGQKIHIEHDGGTIHTLRLLGRQGARDFVLSRRDQGEYEAREVDHAPTEGESVAGAAPDTAAARSMPPESPPSSARRVADEAPASPVQRTGAEDATEHDQPSNFTLLPAPIVEHEVTVERGDSLSSVFSSLDVPRSELPRVMANAGAAPLRRLKLGQVLWLKLLADKRVHSIRTELDETTTLEVARSTDDTMRVQMTTIPLERKVRTTAGVIQDSLFVAGQRAGLSDRVIMQLVEIFGWDVDFALDVRSGDRFSVIFEELYKDGEKARDGNILAAEFVNRGRQLRGIRYTDATGATAYFAPDGLSMRKAFLRTPVNFSRISSGFTSARRHPVLNRIRAHKGVDYAAPTGTPIKAAGNGRITSSGWRRGYGKTVEIQHGAKYSTLYAHMSRIHDRARNSRRVRQGEIIGYVGQTGLATGPHLHYEFRVNGVHQDPLSVKLPKALPIEKQYRADFLHKTQPLVAELDLLSKTSVASSD